MDSDHSGMTLYDFMNSRNRDLDQSSPINSNFTDPQNNTNPHQDLQERSDPRDRIILINPITQRAVMFEGTPSGVNALLQDLINKDGPPPASKESIKAMLSVETQEGDECVICLEEFVCELAKQMPCKHIFHGGCVEKWLKINGSCPVCRYKMPVDENDKFNCKNVLVSEDGGRRREIWVSVAWNINSVVIGGDANQTAVIGFDGDHNEMEGLDD